MSLGGRAKSKRSDKELQAKGHDVFTPTLTGLAERSHLLVPTVNLETHIQDVVNLIRWEELSDVILCGHSYGGAVISGAADRVPDRIRSLVYLDAFVLDDSENVAQHIPQGQVNMPSEDAKKSGADWKVPPIPAEVFKVNPNDREWVDRQCTMFPIRCFTERIKLTGGFNTGRNVTFILATGWDGSPFPPSYERAKAKGWKTLTMASGHDVMLDMPEALTRALLEET